MKAMARIGSEVREAMNFGGKQIPVSDYLPLGRQ